MMARIGTKAKLAGTATLCAGALALVGAGAASASTLTNPTTITPPVAPGPADPYPSTINATGLSGTVEKVRVTLNGLTHGDIEDLDVVLVGPGGQSSMVMSDVCAIGQFTNVTLTFDDLAASSLDPNVCSNASGTFRPSNDVGIDSFPAPGPGLAVYGESFGVFVGTSPNGEWRLFAQDDEAAGGLSVIQGGWTLSLDLKTRCAGRFVTDAGTAGNDVIEGTSDLDVIAGFAGNDTIRGLGDEDVICGGDGKDKLFGGAGKDRLNGEGGKDKLIGGGGSPDICNGAGGKDKASGCEREKKI